MKQELRKLYNKILRDHLFSQIISRKKRVNYV